MHLFPFLRSKAPLWWKCSRNMKQCNLDIFMFSSVIWILVKYIIRTISQFQSFFPSEIETEECHVLNKAVCDSHSPLSHVREDRRSSQTANSRLTTKTLAKLPCTFQTWKYSYERICVIVAPGFLRSDWLIRGESQISVVVDIVGEGAKKCSRKHGRNATH